VTSKFKKDFCFVFKVMLYRDRIKYTSLVIAGLFLNVLDLLGVGLVSFILLQIYSSAGLSKVPSFLEPIYRIFYSEQSSISLSRFYLFLLFFALLVLLLKTILMGFLNKFMSVFLIQQHIKLSNSTRSAFFNNSLETVTLRTSQEVSYILNQGIYFGCTLFLSFSSTILIETMLLISTFGLLAIFFLTESLLVLLYFSLVVFFTHRFITRRARVLSELSIQGTTDANRLVQEAISLHRELTVNDGHKNFSRSIEHAITKVAQGQGRYTFLSQLPKTLLEGSLIIAIGIGALISKLTNSDDSLIPILTTFALAGFRLAPSIIRLQSSIVSFRSLRANLYRVMDFYDSLSNESSSFTSNRTSPTPQDFGFASTNFNPSIVVRDLSYQFPHSAVTLFDGLSFDVQPYESVAIIGPNGIGKSTLLELISGVRKVTEGSIDIGGVPANLAPKLFSKSISYFSQQVHLIDGNVTENIAVGCDPNYVDHERIDELIYMLKLENVFPLARGGKMMHLGENGFRMSGGQRQRIGLARALYSRPKLLILDETTSSQDVESETNLLDYLASLQGQFTLIVVSHKESTVNICNKVLDLQENRWKNRL